VRQLPLIPMQSSRRLKRLSAHVLDNATTAAAASFPSASSIREDLAIAHQLTAKFGMDDIVWNHISARARHGSNDYYITPFPRLFDEVHADNLLEVHCDGVSMNGNVTGDTIHRSILEARPDINAICHSHTPAILAVSCLAGGLMFLEQNSALFYERVGYHDWEGLSTDSAESKALQSSLGPAPNHTLIMRNHGACTVGASVAQAWVRMYYLDVICRNQLEVLKTGAAINYPSPEVLAHTRSQAEENESFAHGASEWDALKRLITDGPKRNAGGRMLLR